MMLDLGSTRTLQLNHYCLRHDAHGSHALRHWDLEGSNDNASWIVLRSHKNDTSLAATAYSEAHWDVNSQTSRTSFRYFRIKQTGKEASGTYDNLCCCGIELYGQMHLTAGNF